MRKIRNELTSSYIAIILLITALLLYGIYFFIGKNLDYMSKTQNQINNEIVSVISDSPSKTLTDEEIQKAFAKAREYNIGISISNDEGLTAAQQPDDSKRILKLEFGGSLVNKQIPVDKGKGTVRLTYFRPFLSGDNTLKFFPAFWRLAASLFILGLLTSWVAALATSGAIIEDLKKLRLITSSLIKGSSIDTGKPAAYAETQPLIDELNQLRRIAGQREELKKRMTADFAHELRTPLTTLQSHLEALIDGIWQPTRERFVSCHEEILRLIRLVGDLEKLSKIEDESIIPEKTGFDFTELAKSISINFAGQFSQRNIAFKFCGESQQIKADKDKISQVIVNLLSNSLKYTPVNGRILLDVTGDKDHVYLIINDSGIGIPAKDISNVFNRLYRSDASRTRATGGAGIGLTIAKSIIEAHRGSVDIVSQEGLGTEITVILPRR